MSRLEEIKRYWSTKAESYSAINLSELQAGQRDAWLGLLRDNTRQGEQLTVLDIGCGPGFFSILMAGLGHRVYAADYNEDMLQQAQNNARRYRQEPSIAFFREDAGAAFVFGREL